MQRFEAFSRGEFAALLTLSEACDTKAAISRRRQHRRAGPDLERRALRAETLVHMGELSSARHALEGANLAKGDHRTRALLTDVNRRPNRPRDPLPDELTANEPVARFELDEHMLARKLRTSRQGAAGGPSGMTTEHLRPMLDDMRGMRMFTEVGSRLAKALVPQVAINLIRVGRLTALSKQDGGVRGIVAGDVVRRLVVQTMAQQLSRAVERATAPFQYALSRVRVYCTCSSPSSTQN